MVPRDAVQKALVPLLQRAPRDSLIFPVVVEMGRSKDGAFLLLNFDMFTSRRRGHVLENEECLPFLRAC
jgi:hypothetical protein